jgi:hypothetical protein
MGVPSAKVGCPVGIATFRPQVPPQAFSPLLRHNHLVFHMIHTPTTSTSFFLQ